MERVARSRCSFVIDDPMRDNFLNPYPKDGHSSLDDLLLRGLKRGIWGLFLGGRAPLGCGKTQNMCVCSEFSQHPILKFCLRLPKNNIPSGFLV